MTSTADVDVVRSIARDALTEITPDDSIGEFVDHAVADDGVATVRFSTKMGGYVGWFWTVSIAAVEGSAPTVLEAELLPGDDALLAPEWTPWAKRLEEYKAQQAAEAERAAAAAAEEDGAENASDDADDEDDDDDDDAHADGSAYLHAGDVDGVDIDELDDDDDDADDEAQDDWDDADDDDVNDADDDGRSDDADDADGSR